MQRFRRQITLTLLSINVDFKAPSAPSRTFGGKNTPRDINQIQAQIMCVLLEACLQMSVPAIRSLTSQPKHVNRRCASKQHGEVENPHSHIYKLAVPRSSKEGGLFTLFLTIDIDVVIWPSCKAALFCPSLWATGLCEDLIKQNKGESQYSTRSIVLIKSARATDRIRTFAISNSDPKSNVLDHSAIGTPNFCTNFVFNVTFHSFTVHKVTREDTTRGGLVQPAANSSSKFHLQVEVVQSHPTNSMIEENAAF
ncbi:hypothetical protein J6590_067917 [Homalodisca vitripennis]|nr:hypothetical protein J6590_067917 [Homalodisca vitripennis]